MTAKAHPVPDAALEADVATIAQKGAGKSFANRGLVERLLDQGRRVVVLDPLNSWWGLKVMADGTPGYPIAVIGGRNADIPLDTSKATALGAALAEGNLSAVIDVSELRRSDLIAFATDFLAELYRRNREPLWLVLEEADVFAPQSPAADGTRAMHDVVDQIARRGRARGFRLWTITQRPARLSKDILTQTSTLLLLRLRSPQDRAAAEAWVRGHAEAARASEIIASLASLPVGEGYVWAPDLDLLKRVKFPLNRTLDTSATPKAGQARTQIKALAKADLGALMAALDTAPEQQAPTSIKDTTFAKIQSARQAGFDEGLARGRTEGFNQALETMSAALASLEPMPAAPRAAITHTQAPTAPIIPPKLKENPAPKSGDLPLSATKMLGVARKWSGTPLRWGDLALLTVIAPSGGSFNAARKALVDSGRIIESSGRLCVTDDKEPLGAPLSAAVIVAAWASKLGGSAGRILRHLYEAGPKSKPEIASALSLAATGGSWNAAWKVLRDYGLAVENNGEWGLAAALEELKKESAS